MRFTMRCISAILSLLLLLPFFPWQIAEASNAGDNLSVGMVSTKTMQIRPFFPEERDIINLYNLVYESLLVVGDSGLPEPYLAREFQFTGGGNSIRVELRDNVLFSDGRKLTAYDVAASGNYILEKANDTEASDRGHYRLMAFNIKNFTAKSETELSIQTARPYFMSLYSLCFPVLPQDMLETVNPPGSGPYVVEKFDAGNSMWLKSNDNWWKQKPQIKDIYVSFYQSSKKMISDFEYGRMDALVTRSLAAAQYKSGIGVLNIPYRTNQLEVMLMNTHEYRLREVQARQAIMKAIDLNLILNRVYIGRASRAYTPFPSSSVLYADLEEYYQYNIDEAKKMLFDLGWEDTDGDGVLDRIDDDGKAARFRLKLLVYEDPENDVRFETANRIKNMLEKLQISVHVELKDIATAQQDLLNQNFDLALVAFQLDEAFDPGFMLMSSNVKAGNYGRYKSERMDSLMNSYRQKYSLSDLAYTAQEIQLLFTEELPFMPICYRQGSILTRKVFTNARDIREKEVFRGIEYFEDIK